GLPGFAGNVQGTISPFDGSRVTLSELRSGQRAGCLSDMHGGAIRSEPFPDVRGGSITKGWTHEKGNFRRLHKLQDCWNKLQSGWYERPHRTLSHQGGGEEKSRTGRPIKRSERAPQPPSPINGRTQR